MGCSLEKDIQDPQCYELYILTWNTNNSDRNQLTPKKISVDSESAMMRINTGMCSLELFLWEFIYLCLRLVSLGDLGHE